MLPVRARSKTAAGGRPRRSSSRAEALGGAPAGPARKTSIRKKPALAASAKSRTPRSRKALAAVKTARPTAVPAVLDYEEVARLAYFYWESRGYQGGSPEEDWYRAEEELRKRSAQ